MRCECCEERYLEFTIETIVQREIGRIVPPTPPSPTPEIDIVAAQYQLSIAEPFNSLNDEVIPFNIEIMNVGGIINNKGNFSIPKDGLYKIDWNIANEGSFPYTDIRYGVKVNNNNPISVAAPTSECQISGTALAVLKKGDIVSVINSRGAYEGTGQSQEIVPIVSGSNICIYKIA